MNLLLIGYCYLGDGFLYASKALEKLGYKISFFPYLSYMMDKVDNIDNILINKIKEENIEVCLWWCNHITYNSYSLILNSLKESNIKPINYFYNWDFSLFNYEKYNANYWKDSIEEKKLYYQLMDHIFTCYQREIDYFKKSLSNKITYAPPGFNSSISRYEYDKNYECDVSIVCTNLYKNQNEFPDDATNITRREIIDKLYENRDKINFHIYGYENIGKEYPDCYKGFIPYNNAYKVFSNSKINLSIHPIVNELFDVGDEAEYFSERVPLILGCGGLLVTNSDLTNKLVKYKDYIYIDKNMDWFNLFLEIINNDEKYDRIRKNGQQKALEHYQWDKWAMKVDLVTKDMKDKT